MFYKGTFMAGFLKKLSSCQFLKKSALDKLMIHSWFTTFKMCWRMPSTVIGMEIKVRKCLETLFQFLKDIAVCHKIPLSNLKSLDKLDIKLPTNSSHFCSLLVSFWQFPLSITSPFPAEFQNITVQEGLRQNGRFCFPCLYPI